ncbi:MAG: RNA methyltransferase [Lachnospiraceae bacterium]|nr:RNA methyltransferase [Lachnospiraceae bacterium]
MITSASNQQIKQISALTGRAKERSRSGLFIAEGSRMVSETPGSLIRDLYLSESFSGKSECAGVMAKLRENGFSGETVLVSDDVFAKMSDTVHPQGICAVVRQPVYDTEKILADLTGKEGRCILVLENVQDPGNVGTMLRTAEAAGAAGLFLSAGCADLFNPKTVRSTMGAIYRVPFVYYESARELTELLKSRGIKVVAACLEGSEEYTKAAIDAPAAVFIGNEGNGLEQETLSLADVRARIPMEGETESLNAAVSAALFLYEVKRRRDAFVTDSTSCD